MKNTNIAIATGNYLDTTKSNVIILDLSLNEIFNITTTQQVEDVVISSQRVYTLGQETLEEISLEGKALSKSDTLTNSKKILDYYGCVLISSEKLEKISKTSIK